MGSKDKSETTASRHGVYTCEQGPELTERIFKLLFRATQNAHKAQSLLFQINQITHEYCFKVVDGRLSESDISYEAQIKNVLELNLGRDILGGAETEHLRECRLALIELMARSHALAKKGKGIKDFT